MSRSYRKPYSTFGSSRSAKSDKTYAHRGERRAHAQYIRDFLCGRVDWDSVPFPVRLECSWNNTYSWGRDGNQTLQKPPRYPHIWVFLFGQQDADEYYQRRLDIYAALHRK